MTELRIVGLRTALIAPVVLLILITVGGMAVLEEWGARAEARQLLDRRAETVVAGIEDRLRDRQRAKEVFVTLLAREGDLPAAIEAASVPSLARILVPLKATLGLGFVHVYDPAGRPLIRLGDADDSLHPPLVREALAGLTRSTTEVSSAGLEILAAGPIKGPGGIVGSIVVGSVLGSEALSDIKARDDIELAALRNGATVAATRRDAGLDFALAGLGNMAVGMEASELQIDDEALESLGFRAAVRRINRTGALVAFIPTSDIIAASRERSARVTGGLLALIVAIVAGGLAVTRGLSGPLDALVAVAAAIGEGSFASRVGPSRIREFHVVAKAINQLSEQVERQLLDLTHQAFYDHLTDLPNRALVVDRLRQALARTQRGTGHVSVMFLDVDDFKVVNDSLGHRAGDDLLVALAARLQGGVRPDDTVARLGGDEFVILSGDIDGPDAARLVADRIAARLADPFRIDGRDVSASMSIGVAISASGYDDPEDLMRNADVAMYHAKTGAKMRCAMFEACMNDSALDRLALTTDLRGAVGRGEMRLAYQPIVDLDSGRILEVEALLRWDHPERGLIPPLDFIPIAEQTGLIVPLGEWVLRAAAHQARRWQDAHAETPITVSVNLSARQFQHLSLVDDVRRILAESGLDPKLLKLEVTESVMMQDIDAAVDVLLKLKALGIRIAVDDFGTDYSSLSLLRRLPVDILKIDRSFVSRLTSGPEDEAIVRSIISLADNLGLSVTGEGIETAEQADCLRTLGCNEGQGYFYARPLDPSAVEALLARIPPILPSESAIRPPAEHPAAA